MIKTLKNGLSIVSSINLENWDFQLPPTLFGYRSGVHVNTKFSPFMVMTRRTPSFTCDNSLVAFINVEKE